MLEGWKEMWTGERAKWVIHSNELLFLRQLGAGTSGIVYEGEFRSNKVAIKVINFRHANQVRNFLIK